MNLTATLLDTTRPLSAEELHERVPGYPPDHESFRRQFERDKEDLRELAIPVRIEKVPGTSPAVDGYRVDRDEYYLPDPGLTHDELAALRLAASVVRMEGDQGTGALWKLGGAIDDDRADHGAAVEVAGIPAAPNLEVLFGAVANRQVARCRYNGRVRELQPYRLDYRRGRWYLTAFDPSHDETRTFRVDRIEGTVELNGEMGAFARPSQGPPGLRLEPWQLGEGDTVTARVRIDAEVVPVAVHHLGAESVVATAAEGSVEVEVPVTNTDGFLTWVAGFLDHAEVLAPAEMREAMVARLEALAGSPP